MGREYTYLTDHLCEQCGSRMWADYLWIGGWVLDCRNNHPKPQILNWTTDRPRKSRFNSEGRA